MHLRRIELQGFKTFYRRTVIDLPKGVTAVVGPNGSGKSNLSDAIRWALGEQSMRPLRIRRAEDVIFGGTDSRSRTGMAEVLLVFDNSDSWLPTPYAEVVIGRRLFRSGESEYSLNGSRVRLRDIVDLMSAGGLGSGGASIVSQGHVDATLSQRPEERRSFLEEVAGIGRFQARRDQAEQRLIATRRNLDRLRDLVAEIEPGLETLRRQAEVAEHGRELELEFQEARVSLARHRLDVIGDQITEAESREQVVAKRMAEFSVTSAADLNRQASEADLDVQTQNAEVGTCRIEEGSSLDTLRELEARQQRLRERLVNLTARAEDISERSDALNGRQASIESDEAQDRAALAELTPRVGQRAQRLMHVNELFAAARAAADRRNVRADELAELQACRAMLRDREERIERDCGGIRESRADMVKHHEVATSEAEQARAAVTAEQARVTHAAKEERDAEARASDTESEVRRLAQERITTERALAGHSARLDALDAERHSLLSVDSANGALGSAGGDDISHVDGVLGKVRVLLPQTPMHNAHLLELALPGLLDDWIIGTADDSAAAGAAAGDIKLTSIGLRPLESPGAPVVSKKLREHPDVLGSLDRYVDVNDDRLAKILRRIAVVLDLDAALRVRAACAGLTLPPIVALTGASVDAAGAIHIGHVEPMANHAAVRLQDIERLVDQATEGKLAAEGAVAQAAALAQIASTRAEQGRELRTERTAEHTQARELLTTAVGGSERASGRLATASERQAEAANRLASLQDELENISDERKAVELALSDVQVDGCGDDVVSDLSAIEHEHATLTADERADEARIAELRAQSDARSAHARHMENEQSHVAALTAEVEESIASTRSESNAVDSEVGRAVTTVDEARNAARDAELAMVETRLTAQRLHMQAAQRAEEERRAAEDLNAAQRETERLAERLGDLKRVAREDLGVGDLTPCRLDEPAGRVERRIAELRRDLAELGPLNPLAPDAYRTQRARVDGAREQIEDLEGAEENLRTLAARLQRELHSQFVTTFEDINTQFGRLFQEMFEGGSAAMTLTSPDDVETTGVEFHVRLPGKRQQEMAALSGGERSLVSTALIMALLHVRKSPFCVLDEVDAALDDANVERFCRQLNRLGSQSQMLVITHNAITVESAAAIYGVTMSEEGVSDLLSLSMGGAPTKSLRSPKGGSGNDPAYSPNGASGHNGAHGASATNHRARTTRVETTT